MLLLRFGLIFSALLAVSACQTIKVDVQKVEQKAPVEIASHRDLAPIKFDRVSFKIKRGAAIGSYDSDVLGLSPCYGQGGNIFWQQGRMMSRNIEFTDIFYNTMKNANFNVIGDPDKMFAQSADHGEAADFLIGGMVEDIKMNVCEEKNLWTGMPLNRQKGKGAVKVRWQVFSLLNRKVIYETLTEGFTKLETGTDGGEMLIIQDAFAAAAENLAADEKFVTLLKETEPEVASLKSIDTTRIIIPKVPLRTSAITDLIDQTRLAVVTITQGGGHGSGFFIADTLVLTNKHVVGDSEIVRVQLLTGRKILGEVIRRDPVRDVALVQVEKTAVKPLPIRRDVLKVTEEVYAIGSPILERNSGTVTKGIVSKFGVNSRGLEDIQADVDIQGGNSGGALLDKKGNLVGISYAGSSAAYNNTSIGLNFFIPIADAMQKLNIKIKGEEEES